jgi:hypothetical protein
VGEGDTRSGAPVRLLVLSCFFFGSGSGGGLWLGGACAGGPFLGVEMSVVVGTGMRQEGVQQAPDLCHGYRSED